METDPTAILDVIGPEAAPAEGKPGDYEVAVRQYGQWQLVWRRFRRHRLAVWSMRCLLLLILLAIVGPLIAPPASSNPLAAYGSPTFATGPKLWPFSLSTLMGRDIFATPVALYVLGGARATLEIGIFGSLLAALIGCLIGGVAGYFGGVVDAILMRVVDAFLTIPFLPFLMVIALFLTDRRAPVYAVLFGLAGWAGVARLVRSGALTVKEREYVEAARALGVSDGGLIMRHVLPNTLDILIVACTLNVAVFVLAEAALDFVGAGPTDITWAKGMVFGAGNILNLYWWTYAFPGSLMLVTALSANFLGDGLRDALDVSGGMPAVEAAEDRDGRVYRSVVWAGGRVAWALSATRAAITGPLGGLRPSMPARRTAALPRRARPVVQPRTVGGRWIHAATVAVPIVLLFAVSGIGFLYGHSPLRYSPYYSSPVTVASTQEDTFYGAVARPDGGWSLAYVTGKDRLEYAQVDGRGHVVTQRLLAPHGALTSQPSLAAGRHAGLLAVWVAPNTTTLMAAHIGGRASSAFRIATGADGVEHPYAVDRPDGGYDVLYEAGTGHGALYNIYLATVAAGGTHPISVHRLTHAKRYAFYPRGVYDGHGTLNVIYMDWVEPTLWSWKLERVSPAGHLLGRPRVVDHVLYHTPNKYQPQQNVFPDRWGVDLKRAPDGSVWMAWDGNAISYLEHWSATGRVLLPKTPTITVGIEAETDTRAERSLALVPIGSGGVLYHSAPGEQEPYMAVYHFNRNGVLANPSPERVSYDAGGLAQQPSAAAVRGRPQMIWARVGATTASLESASSHPFRGPDLLTRLGLNIGNIWGNIAFVTFGALALGVGLIAINLLLILALALLSIPLRRVVPYYWLVPAYAVVLGVTLLLLFAPYPNPPAVVLVISGLGAPYGLWAALGGTALAAWAGWFPFRRQDSLFRAISMTITGFYFVSVMYAVIFIEGQIGRI